jgi:predicted ATP-grasp superfamily ATP-dependent carboligase
MLIDKVRFAQFARTQGLPFPLSMWLHTPADAEQAADTLRLPCILKPAVKTPRWEAATTNKGYVVHSREELLSFYRQCSQWSDKLLAQEWIPGDVTNNWTCNTYFSADSQPLATCVSRKLRQWPPETGTGCLSEAVHNDRVAEICLRLFQRLGFRGLGYVETKFDPRTGEYVILEPNIGRPTGRSANAEAAGIDLLYTMYCDLAGRPVSPQHRPARDGAKWIHWRRDVLAALYHWRRGELSSADWWKSWRGPKRSAIFSLTDPGPFLAEVARVVPWLLRRGTSR